MPARLGRFEMPKSLTKDKVAQLKPMPNSSPNRLRQGMARSLATLYAEFFCRLWKELLLHPFGLLGAQHEFATLTGIVEDVTDIVSVSERKAGLVLSGWFESKEDKI
jgi:DNA-directed RNA polymerase subunit alpha